MNQQFRSSISIIIAVPITLLFLFNIYNVLIESNQVTLGWVVLWIFIFGFTILILFGIRYVVTETHIIIKMGPFTFLKLAIEALLSINRSYNPISSPAGSLRRMQLNFTDGVILISPRNENKFIHAIKVVNPKVSIGIKDEVKHPMIRFLYWLL